MMLLKMLDCFCGMGGASEGFAREGFEVTGIDIVFRNYHYNFILKDINFLDGKDFQGYDVIWGSPPCREFSPLAYIARARMERNQKGQWKKPPNIENGLKLVNAYLSFVKDANPELWIMENVLGLANHLDLKPLAVKTPLWGGKRHVFYGNFPSFLIPITERKIKHEDTPGKWRSWERAKISLACSLAFARACKEELLKEKQLADV